MPLSITLEISDRELEYFQSVLRKARDQASRRDPHEITAAAQAVVTKLQSSMPSQFVAARLRKVAALAAMLDDPQWQLPERERRRVLAGLAYVAQVHDLVPDDVPVLGLLDDAIMLELVLRDLQHELEGYEEFDAYRRRETSPTGPVATRQAVSCDDWLESKRRALHERIVERRERELERSGGDFPLITHF
ncbi:MAG TPA: DUF1232 domain-containing protein [Steroidobacteraceae bacterium]